MASNNLTMDLDARKLARRITVTVGVTIKKTFWVHVGFFVIRVGCWIAGTQYEEE